MMRMMRMGSSSTHEDDADDDDDYDIVPGTLVLSRQARRGGKVHLDGDSTYDHIGRWSLSQRQSWLL